MNNTARKILAAASLLLAIALLLLGARKGHEVDTGETDEFGQKLTTEISERELVIQTTFGGLVKEDDGRLRPRKEGGLEKAGKQACPT